MCLQPFGYPHVVSFGKLLFDSAVHELQRAYSAYLLFEFITSRSYGFCLRIQVLKFIFDCLHPRG